MDSSFFTWPIVCRVIKMHFRNKTKSVTKRSWHLYYILKWITTVSHCSKLNIILTPHKLDPPSPSGHKVPRAKLVNKEWDNGCENLLYKGKEFVSGWIYYQHSGFITNIPDLLYNMTNHFPTPKLSHSYCDNITECDRSPK